MVLYLDSIVHAKVALHDDGACWSAAEDLSLGVSSAIKPCEPPLSRHVLPDPAWRLSTMKRPCCGCRWG